MDIYEKSYEVRWLLNNKIYTRKFYNRETTHDFKKNVIEQGSTNVNLYYQNKKIATYNKFFNMDWDNDYIIRCKVDLIDLQIDAGFMPSFEDMFIKENYLSNRLAIIELQINYCLDTYPENRELFDKLSEEFNKINKQLESYK